MKVPRASSLLAALLLAIPLSLSASAVHHVAAPGTGPMPYISSPLSVAFGPEGGVAVWRVGFSEIWGVALDRDGRPTGPAHVILTDALGTEAPSVHYFGESFVLWWKNGYPALSRTVKLTAQATLAAEIKTLTVSASPAVDNRILILAFGKHADQAAALFFDIAGNLIRTSPLTGVGVVYGASSVAFNDGSFGVLTTGWSGLYLTRFTADGHSAGAPLLIEPSRGTTSTDYRPQNVAAATDGTNIFVVWTAAAHGSLPDVKTAILLPGNTVSAYQSVESQGWKTIAWLQARFADGFYTVTTSAGQWDGRETDDCDLYAARFGADGRTMSDGFVRVLERPGLETWVTARTSNGKHLLFFHQGDANGMSQLFVVGVPAAGSLQRQDITTVDARLSDSAAWQRYSSAASDGNGSLAVWHEQLADREEIRIGPLRADGSPAAAPVTLALAFRYLGAPSAAFNGIDYVVAWHQGTSLLAKRVRRDGVPLDETPLVITTDASASAAPPALAARGGLTLFSWTSRGSIYVTLLNATGQTSPPVLVSPLPRQEQDFTVGYEGSIVAAGARSFLVAFKERRSFFCVGIPCPSDTKARARVVTLDGVLRGALLELDAAAPVSSAGTGGTYLLALSGPAGAVIIDEATAKLVRTLRPRTGFSQPRVFADGGGYAVASHAERTSNLAVYRYSADGTLLRGEHADAIGHPAAVNLSGAFLVTASSPTRAAPYFGAPAVLTQLIDAFKSGTGARPRIVRR